MPNYRIYLLDGVDKIASAEEFVAISDEAAMTKAYRLAHNSAVELWCGFRMVARVPMMRRAADASRRADQFAQMSGPDV